jgi:hypothetical protein
VVAGGCVGMELGSSELAETTAPRLSQPHFFKSPRSLGFVSIPPPPPACCEDVTDICAPPLLPEGYILSKCFSDSVKKFCKIINPIIYILSYSNVINWLCPCKENIVLHTGHMNSHLCVYYYGTTR